MGARPEDRTPVYHQPFDLGEGESFESRSPVILRHEDSMAGGSGRELEFAKYIHALFSLAMLCRRWLGAASCWAVSRSQF